MAPKLEPGRDAEMASRTRKLNVVFALTSIGLLITFSLMIWYDYDRPWKKHQNEFTLLEVKRTELEIQEALGKVDASKRKALEDQIARGEDFANAARESGIDYGHLLQRIVNLGLEWEPIEAF